MGLTLSKIAKVLRPKKPAVQSKQYSTSSGKSLSDKVLTTIGNHEKKIEAFMRKVEALNRNAQYELQRSQERQVKGDTRGAIASANRYKKIISQRNVIEGSIYKLEEQVFALQDAQAADATVRELQTGNEALKTLREGGLNAEEASEVRSNTADELSELQAVNDLIADRSENEMSNEDLDNFLAEHAEKNLAGHDSGSGARFEPSAISVEDLDIFPADHIAGNDTLAAAFSGKGASTYEMSRMLPSVPLFAPKNSNKVKTAGLVQP